LGDISWVIEEASVARFLRLKNNILFSEIKKFIDFVENKEGFHSKSEILNDLIKFQIFLLTTREHLEEIKEEEFMYDWKNYFVNNSKIMENKKHYFYKNQITEKDPIKWIWDVVWYGRKEVKYKIFAKFLQERVELKLSK